MAYQTFTHQIWWVMVCYDLAHQIRWAKHTFSGRCDITPMVCCLFGGHSTPQFLRCGHSPGGIIGITIKPSTLKRWALSLHICSQLVKEVSEIRDKNDQKAVLVHKEEMPARQKADGADREKLHEKLKTCIDPLQPDSHSNELVNILSGRVAPSVVNVDSSVSIGLK